MSAVVNQWVVVKSCPLPSFSCYFLFLLTSKSCLLLIWCFLLPCWCSAFSVSRHSCLLLPGVSSCRPCAVPSLSADTLVCRCFGVSYCRALAIISLLADNLACRCSGVSSSLALDVLSLFMASLNSRLFLQLCCFVFSS